MASQPALRRAVTWDGLARDERDERPHVRRPSSPIRRVQEALKPMFADGDAVKEKVWEALKKPEYNVTDFYHKTGVWRRIATHPAFEHITIAVICLNSLWMWIDTDNNPASTLLDARPTFQIVEHIFCCYLFFEWYVRFSAFKRKHDGLKDRWFVFDSCLAFMMVAETWVMTTILLCLDSGGVSSITGAPILRMFRLLRLSRLARMLRSMPELMILIKGMLAASRSVFFTMCLLVLLLYFFAIVMRQLTEGTPVGQQYFYSVPASMYKLLVEGVFLDRLGLTVNTIAASGFMFAVVFFVFVVLAALMVMNMLIGVLCEVVGRVASAEQEEMSTLTLKANLARVMAKLDQNNDGMLSEMEFVQLVSCNESVKLLDEVGVDPVGLLNIAPSIFSAEEDEQEDDDDDEGTSKESKEINFQQFMEIVLDHRGSTTASLKDLRELKNDLVNEIQNLKVKLNFSRRRSSGSRITKGFSRQSSVTSFASASCPADMFLSDHPPSSLGMAAQSSTSAKSPRMLRRSMTSPSLAAGWPAEEHSPHSSYSPCSLPGSNEVDGQSAMAEDVPSCRFPPARGDGRDGVDMQEVEGALRRLQAALKKMRRPGLLGVVCSCRERSTLDWADRVSQTAASELEALQRLQAAGLSEVPYDSGPSEDSTMASGCSRGPAMASPTDSTAKRGFRLGAAAS